MTKTSSQNPYAEYASDEIVFIPRKHIHPDPDQPRVNADAELRASIEAQGIIQAITVRPHPSIGEAFLIVDGERRYNGSVALAEIPCRIRLDLEDDADRLITQITANTGKPLSPIEQARAFKKILDADEKLTQVELAKRLGVPRSTVGDRIRLFELPAQWLELLESGQLQVSHAPALMPFREMKAAIHDKVVKDVQQSHEWKESAKRGTMEVAQFERLVRSAYHAFLHPLSTGGWPCCQFKPKEYKGLIVTCGPQWGAGKAQPYAADPDVWKPLVKAAEADLGVGNARGVGADTAKPVASKNGLKLLLPRTTQILKTNYTHDTPKGVTMLTDPAGRLTVKDLDADVLLQELAPDTIVRVAAPYSSGIDRTATRDKKAIAKAREAWEEKWSIRRLELEAATAEAMKETLARHTVSGAGLRAVAFAAIGEDPWFDTVVPSWRREAVKVAGVAPPDMGKRAFGDSSRTDDPARVWVENLTHAQLSKFVAAWAAISAGELRSIDQQIEDEKSALQREYSRRAVSWIERPKAKDGSDLGICDVCDSMVPETELVAVDDHGSERQCAKCKAEYDEDQAAFDDEDEAPAEAEELEEELVGA